MLKEKLNSIIDFVKFRIILRAKLFFEDFNEYLTNLRTFRKELWNFRPFDYAYCNDMYVRSLETLKNYLRDNGNEIEETRLKKVAALEELIERLKYDAEDDEELIAQYIKHDVCRKMDILTGKFTEDVSEKDINLFYKEYKAFMSAVEKKNAENLKRIFRIISGQPKKDLDTPKDLSWTEKENLWNEKFDGTGYFHWWD